MSTSIFSTIDKIFHNHHFISTDCNWVSVKREVRVLENSVLGLGLGLVTTLALALILTLKQPFFQKKDKPRPRPQLRPL